MSTYILVIWTVVGLGHYMGTTTKAHDWRPIGEFTTEAACREGARQLNVPQKNFRCLKK